MLSLLFGRWEQKLKVLDKSLGLKSSLKETFVGITKLEWKAALKGMTGSAGRTSSMRLALSGDWREKQNGTYSGRTNIVAREKGGFVLQSAEGIKILI